MHSGKDAARVTPFGICTPGQFIFLKKIKLASQRPDPFPDPNITVIFIH